MIEIKVRPVTRYIVTRYSKGPADHNGRFSAGCEQCGEFDNALQANDIAGALYERSRSMGLEVEVEYEPIDTKAP